RRGPSGERRPGALSRRARAGASGRARARRAADRPRTPVAGDRGFDQLLQGPRARARRADLAANTELPGPPRAISRQGRGGARAAGADSASTAPATDLGGDRRLSVLRIRRGGELPSLLDSALGGAAHVSQGDGLCDVAVPDRDARVAALLGTRDRRRGAACG